MSRINSRSLLLVLAGLVCLLPVLASAQVNFAPAQSYPLNAVPFRVLAGDLNGDGQPDLVALSVAGGTVSALLNKGNGTFAPPRDFPAITPSDPTLFSGIKLADVNGDQKLDVIVTENTDPNAGNGIINVLLGNGDGTFQAPITTPVDSEAYKFVGVGDFNSDGRLDIVCIADDPTNTVVSIVLFLGNGDGTFTRDSSSQPATGYPGLVDAVLLDVNHDGKLDVVLPNGVNLSGGQSVTVLLGNGDGTFQPPAQESTPAPTAYVSAGDFNGDGKPDLISTSYQLYQCVCPGFGVPDNWVPEGPPGSVSMLLEKGDGSFTSSTFAADLGPSVEGDFDGDGNLDFSAQSILPPVAPGPFQLYLGDGKGNFSSPSEITQSIANPLTADLDGDGLTDLIWPASNSSLQLALNNSSTFMLASSTATPIPAGGSATYTISVAQQHGQGAMVTLTCSASAGSGIHCSLSPSSVAAGGTATLTVTTTGPSAGLVLPSSQDHRMLQFAMWLPFGAVFFCGFGAGKTHRKKLLGLTMGSVFGASLMFFVACGGASTPDNHKSIGTPPGTYAITVTGTAGTVTRSTNVNLTVQ